MYRLIHFPEHKDDRGTLTVFDGFKVKRAFTMQGMKPDSARGEHANKETSHIIVALTGKCKVTVDDGEHKKETFVLDSPTTGLFVGAGVWRTMHSFAPDTTLLCLADKPFNENDYIRDYSEFLATIPIEVY